MDDLGVPLFSETPIYIYINIYIIAILQNILLHDLRFPIQQPARAADVEQLQLHVPSEKKNTSKHVTISATTKKLDWTHISFGLVK